MRNIQFSRKLGHYEYAAELAYLKTQPQTKEALKQRADLLYELALRDIPYFASVQKSRDEAYCNELGLTRRFNQDQLRIPAGSEGAGRWAPGGSSLLHDAQYVPAIPAPGPLGAAIAGAAAAIQLYNYLTSRQAIHPDDEARPIIEFEHREYSPTLQDGASALAQTRTLTREETLSACPRLAEVQSRVDRIDFETRLNYPDLSAQQHGTTVHKTLEGEIKAQFNPNFVAEVSILKSANDGFATYGRTDTVRIDVLENADTQTVCVYDIKTGKAGLSASRSTEIAGEVYIAFGKLPQRIIVTEVRPKR